MNVLLINGSAHAQGNTHRALEEVAKALKEEGIGSQIISIGYEVQADCIACGACSGGNPCAMGGAVYEQIREALEKADGLVVGSPVYYAGPTGAICSLLDRVFMTCKKDLLFKPAAAVVVCRRGGATSALDRLNKYFQIFNMPQVTSSYWNMVHGNKPGEVEMDEEGLQTMRTLAHNMAWLIKNNQGKERPQLEEKIKTNFIR